MNKCVWCGEKQAQLTSDYCVNCEWKSHYWKIPDGYQDWVIETEYHSDGSSYYSCKRCGELVNGVNASVVHFEKKHKLKFYPDGFAVEVVGS